MKEIIYALNLFGQMSHKELCDYLHLKESTLTEIMKKDAITKFIYFSRFGKYKVYRLTDTGRILGKQLQQENGSNLSNQIYLKKYEDITEKFLKSKKENDETYNQDDEHENLCVLRPGGNINIFSKVNGKIDKQSYGIEALLLGNNDNDEVTVMARKQKYKNNNLELAKNINIF